MFLAAAVTILSGCGHTKPSEDQSLRDRLYTTVNEAHGTVGIAFVSDADTVLVNNGVRYPLMSVFKLHEALAVADALERRNTALDSVILIPAACLDRNTWSPMLKVYGDSDFDISVGELVRYALVSSDNNASNILFDRIVSPKDTDVYIRSIAADTTFSICYSEAEMKQNHTLSYRNYSSPLSAALLMRQLFTSELVSPASQDSIKEALATVTTGHDRLGAAVDGQEDVLFAHKTGSGYRNDNGELAAFNDVAYVRLPDGRDYSLAVMIRDFSGSEAEAAAIMAEISKTVFSHFTAQQDDN